jgi:hypothetical protein
MLKKTSFFNLLFITIFIATVIYACSKGSGTNTPSNPCSGVTVTLTGTIVNATTVSSTDGSIIVSASGGSNFTFSLNSGAFQSSGTFINLSAGVYTIVAKNSNGCTGSKQFTITAPNACTGIGITVTGTSTSATPCQTANGTISATASGSTGFTYSIDGVNFQASGNFTGLNAGSYIVTAKNAAGCTGSTNVTITNSAAGPLFTAVRSMMQANCVSCHNASNANGGMNWEIDCNIVANKDRIKARAVDGNPSPMPPTGLLPQSERDKITNWINAGGRYTD